MGNEIREMTVNRLPAPTWNRMRVNSAVMDKLPPFGGQCSVSIENGTEDIAIAVENPGEDSVASGMGEDIGALMRACHVPSTSIRIPAGRRIARPLTLKLHLESDDSRLARQTICAGRGSEATIILDYTSSPECRGLMGIQTIVHLEEGAVLRLIKSQMLGADALHFDDIGAFQAAGSSFQLVRVELGAKSAWSGCFAQLLGAGCSFDSSMGYFCRDSQLLDINDSAIHIGKKTRSRMEIEGALSDSARKIFRGTIDFRPGSSKSAGEEQENTLLLSPHAVNKTVPLILCGEDDVEGNHGATIGKMDEDMLFYMDSRGIDRRKAEEMMVGGKINRIAERIPDKELTSRIKTFVKEAFFSEERLP